MGEISSVVFLRGGDHGFDRSTPAVDEGRHHPSGGC